jgi:hypothetical protein
MFILNKKRIKRYVDAYNAHYLVMYEHKNKPAVWNTATSSLYTNDSLLGYSTV